jgi:hypothetical protein
MHREARMTRWFVFFFIVAVLVAVSGLWGLTAAAPAAEAGRGALIGKLLFFAAIAGGAIAFAGWLGYVSRRSKPSVRRHAAPGVEPSTVVNDPAVGEGPHAAAPPERTIPSAGEAGRTEHR